MWIYSAKEKIWGKENSVFLIPKVMEVSLNTFHQRKIPPFFFITVGMQTRVEKTKNNHKNNNCAVYIWGDFIEILLVTYYPFKNVPQTIKIICTHTHTPTPY